MSDSVDEIGRIVEAHASRTARLKSRKTASQRRKELAARVEKIDVFNPVDVRKKTLAHLDLLLPMAFGSKGAFESLASITRHPAKYWQLFFHRARYGKVMGRAGLDEIITSMDAHIQGVRDHLNDMERELNAVRDLRRDWTLGGREREPYRKAKAGSSVSAETPISRPTPPWWTARR